MALVDDINNLPEVPADGSTGHLVNHRTIHQGLKDLFSRVTTLAERVPSNTALKKDTTFGTSYSVDGTAFAGESRTVDITSRLSLQPNSGTLEVRRSGNWVHYDFKYLNFNEGIEVTFNLPIGWIPGRNQKALLLGPDGSVMGRFLCTWDGQFTLHFDKAFSADMLLSFPLRYGAPFPTTNPS